MENNVNYGGYMVNKWPKIEKIYFSIFLSKNVLLPFLDIL